MTAIEHEPALDFPTVLKDDELFTAPSEFLALSHERPVWRLNYSDGTVGWLVFDLPRARVVLNDPRFSVLPAGFAADDGGFGKVTEELQNPGDLLRLDPPQHTRVRKALTAFFTVRAIAELRGAIEQIVEIRLDEMEKAGPPVDYVRTFARVVPSWTICSMLGVPFTDAWRFEQPMRILAAWDGSSVDEKRGALDDFYVYVREVIARKRAEPGDDLISALLEREELTDDELAGVAWFLFAAGHETTASAFTHSMFFLLYEPGRWQAMQAYPIDAVVEELFRYLPSRTALPQRTALEDVDLDGYLVRAGEHVTVYQTVLHRQAERYPEPDAFDPTRDSTGHIFFGFGRHMCLGQHLARLEVQVGLGALLKRFPDLHLAVTPDEVPISREGFTHGMVKELPVAW